MLVCIRVCSEYGPMHTALVRECAGSVDAQGIAAARVFFVFLFLCKSIVLPPSTTHRARQQPAAVTKLDRW